MVKFIRITIFRTILQPSHTLTAKINSTVSQQLNEDPLQMICKLFLVRILYQVILILL